MKLKYHLSLLRQMVITDINIHVPPFIYISSLTLKNPLLISQSTLMLKTRHKKCVRLAISKVINPFSKANTQLLHALSLFDQAN